MTALPSIARNVISQLAAAWIVGVVTIGVQVTFARQLGPAVFGSYGIAMSIAGIAFIFQDGGFRSLLYREATHPTPGLPVYPSLLSRALGWNILATGFTLALAIGCAAVYGAFVGSVAAVMIVTNMGRIASLDISSLMRAGGRFLIEAKWQTKIRVSIGLLMIAATLMTGNLIVILACGAVTQFAYLLLPSARRMLSTPAFKWNSDIFRICAALVAIDLVTALYFRSDVLIMAALGRSKEEIGIYSALGRIVEAYIFLVAPVAVTFFRSARMELNDQKSTARTLWRLSAIVGAPTLVLLALTTEYNEWMVHLIFGSQFQSGATYLAWLIAACCATAPNALLGQCLLASNKERYFLAAVLGALAVNLSLNLALIATRGATGAAQATFATEFSLLLFLTIAFYAPMRKSVMASPRC